MKKTKKILSLLLSLAMFVTCVNVDIYNAMAVAITKEDELYIQLDGKPVNSVTVPQVGDKVLLTTQKYNDVNYHWQLAINGNTKEWVNIYGQTHNFISLSWAMLESIVDNGGKTYIRCTAKKDDTLLVSDPVLVSVSYSAPEQISVCDAETEQNDVLSAMLALSAAAPQALVKHTVKINYVYEGGSQGGSQAFEPFIADVADGEPFNYHVQFPTAVGYEAYFENDTTASKYYQLDLESVTADIEYTVTYKPAEVEFRVKYLIQNIDDDNYEVMKDADGNDFIKTLKGLTGTKVGIYDKDISIEYTGFTMLFYDNTVEIAADGSTEIEIYYDRNYYLVYFDLDGGYGVDPIYARYGKTFSANAPTRAGYVFKGWELATVGVNTDGTFDDRPASDEEKVKYELKTNVTLPAMNLKYQAIWDVTTTHYTIVYWKENADDDGYTYWGSRLVGVAADGTTENGNVKSGYVVSGKDDIKDYPKIHNDEWVYFTYNAAKTDKNVIVEGDGSTVVNVYYYRNVYTIYFKGISGTCQIEEHTHGTDCDRKLECTIEEHTHGETCEREITCGRDVHAHTDDCLICGKEVHTEHTQACCILPEHSHTKECWGDVVGNKASPIFADDNSADGQVYRGEVGLYSYSYIYIKGQWYDYSGDASNTDIVAPSCGSVEHTHGTGCTCNLEIHTHNSDCYKDAEHEHTDACYTYTCGKTEHKHTDSCYTPCKKLEHTHTNQCDQKSKDNVIYVVTAKYEQNIADVWPTADKDEFTNITLNGWRIDGISSNAVSKRVNMTSDLCDTSDKLKYASVLTGGNKKYLYYMFESFDQTSPANGNERILREGVYYDKSETYYQEVNSNGSWNQKQIMGMTAVSDGVVTSGSNIFLYYTRSRHSIVFYNYGNKDVKTVTDVMYEQPLNGYKDSEGNLLSEFVPDYPETLEPNAYDFAGWYTTAECFDGTEFNFDTATMPNGDLALYAKWEPTKHTVNVYNKEEDIETKDLLTSKIVPHGDLYGKLEADPHNGDYVFNGWFYRDVNGEEKAFDFNNMPVRRDLDIYAKWSSVTPVQCKLEYKVKNTDGTETTIADEKTVIILDGYAKTFDAKAGNELYEGYREHYYPETNSHTITANAEDDSRNKFTFYYTFKENVEYTVEYRDSETKALMEGTSSITQTTGKTVVVEFYKQFNGYMPDAYQKKLVLSANKEENVITFWYTKDTEHAMYLIRYWTENLDGTTYTEYRDIQGPETIGNTIDTEIIDINGFEYKHYKITTGSSTFDGSTLPSDAIEGDKNSPPSGTLTSDGLIIDLYYDRLPTEYTVKYLDASTGNSLINDKIVANKKYGETVKEDYVEIPGYNITGDRTKSIVLKVDKEQNVIRFYYNQKNVNISYVAVPENGGTLSHYSDPVQAVTGNPTGSTPTAAEGWRFDGWYTDENCTNKVDTSWVDANNKITPQKNSVGIYESATYYAKFVEELADLTIKKTGVDEKDQSLTFMFKVEGEGVDMVVTVKGNSSVVIKNLKVGDYTVTEITDWSWRYEPDGDAEQSVELVAGGKTVEFKNKLTNKQWLDDETSVDNIYDGNKITQKTTEGK